MGNVIKDYEHPEQVWKEVYYDQLVEVEEVGLHQAFPIQLVIERLPKYSRWSDMWQLVAGAMMCFGAAYCFSRHTLPCGFVSGAFLNLGMGIIVGILLAHFSDRRMRIIDGYEVVAKTMRNRMSTLQSILSNYLADPHFVLFNLGNKKLACEWLHVHQNFVLMMKAHFGYWDEKLKGKVNLGFEKVVTIADEKICDMGFVVQKNTLKMTQDELRVFCEEVWRLETGLLKSYEKRIELLEAKVLDVRFGAFPQTRWECLRDKCIGGRINDQIRIDFALENQE